MTESHYLILLATGVLSGTLGGLLGIGGGVVVVPVLLPLLAHLRVPPEHVVHLAVATSLATVFFTNVSSTWAHYRAGNVAVRLVAWAAPAAALSGIGGALLANYLPGEIHRRIFATFLFIVAVRLVRGNGKEEGIDTGEEVPLNPTPIAALGAGAGVGTLAGLLGIGGGSLAVPLFHLALRYPIHEAVGSSAAVGAAAALLGTLGHGLLPYPPTGEASALPTWGFVIWPAALVISLAAVPGAQLGARLANRLPSGKLRRAFGGFLAIVAVKLFV